MKYHFNSILFILSFNLNSLFLPFSHFYYTYLNILIYEPICHATLHIIHLKNEIDVSKCNFVYFLDISVCTKFTVRTAVLHVGVTRTNNLIAWYFCFVLFSRKDIETLLLRQLKILKIVCTTLKSELPSLSKENGLWLK